MQGISTHAFASATHAGGGTNWGCGGVGIGEERGRREEQENEGEGGGRDALQLLPTTAVGWGARQSSKCRQQLLLAETELYTHSVPVSAPATNTEIAHGKD